MYATTPDRPAAVHAQAFPGARRLSMRRRRTRALRVALLAALLTVTLLTGLAPLRDASETLPQVAASGAYR